MGQAAGLLCIVLHQRYPPEAILLGVIYLSVLHKGILPGVILTR